MHNDNSDQFIGHYIVLLVHGVNGTVADLEYAANAIRTRYDQHVIVLSPTINHGLTHSGIGSQSQRLYDYLIEQLNSYQNAKYISIIGFSLGGLIARHLSYLLYQNKIIPNRLTPISLITVATPNLGSRHHSRLGFGVHFTSFAALVAGVFLGQTGRQLFLSDGPDSLLIQMTNDDHLDALRQFRHRIAYACSRHDLSVGFTTAAICRLNTFHQSAPGSLIEFLDDGQKGIQSSLDAEEEAIRSRLDTLEWRRVVFTPTKRFFGHFEIMVTSSSRAEHGAVVINDIVQCLNIV